MTQPVDPNDALRQRILVRVREINGDILTRLAVVSDDLDAGAHLAAFGGLDGLELKMASMRSLLNLLR